MALYRSKDECWLLNILPFRFGDVIGPHFYHTLLCFLSVLVLLLYIFQHLRFFFFYGWCYSTQPCQFFLQLSLSSATHLSSLLSVSLSSSLSLKLSDCLFGRMSAIDLYRQHFSSDGSLWVVPNRIQQTGDHVSGELAGR